MTPTRVIFAAIETECCACGNLFPYAGELSFVERTRKGAVFMTLPPMVCPFCGTLKMTLLIDNPEYLRQINYRFN